MSRSSQRSTIKDMTNGSPAKLILGFAVPMLMGLLFQQFYSMVDTIIVGKFLGVDALASVGSTSAINFMINGFVIGVCTGFSIPVAQRFGAQDYKDMRRFVANAGWIASCFAVVMTVIVCLMTRQILVWMQTPDNIIDGAYSYIFFIFAGIPATYLYNTLAGIIRALGDSKTPVYFLILSSLLNIALDLLFIVQIGTGTAGAAYATVISQAVSGILRQGIFSKDEIIVSNLTDEGRARSEKTLGVVTTLDNNEIVRSAKTVVLAVKPQFYEKVLTEVHDSLTTEHTIIGIAPGKTLAWLEEKAGLPLKVVRFMPNTPAQVGAGMTAVCTNDRVSEDELAEILKITDSFGCTEVIPERLMDAAGAVGGCSPAYVFMFIEAMADAAVSQGMPRKQAYKFASQTVLGSAKMVLETGRHPGDLKDMVCSPAGTTIEGVRTLEKSGFRSAVFEALTAAAEKGKKL